MAKSKEDLYEAPEGEVAQESEVTEGEATEATEAKKRGPRGVGAFIKAKLVEGELTHEQILELVHQEFPENVTTMNCVKWYANAIKKWPDGKRPSGLYQGKKNTKAAKIARLEALKAEIITLEEEIATMPDDEPEEAKPRKAVTKLSLEELEAEIARRKAELAEAAQAEQAA